MGMRGDDENSSYSLSQRLTGDHFVCMQCLILPYDLLLLFPSIHLDIGSCGYTFWKIALYFLAPCFVFQCKQMTRRPLNDLISLCGRVCGDTLCSAELNYYQNAKAKVRARFLQEFELNMPRSWPVPTLPPSSPTSLLAPGVQEKATLRDKAR